MGRVVVIGASIAGLSAGLLLAREGHVVTVLDRDDVSPGSPDEVVASAYRPGAPHAVQPHAILSLARMVLRDRIPDVLTRLYGQGVVDLPVPPPPSLASQEVPVDPDLVFLMVRRPVAEWALRDAAAHQPGLEVLARQTVTGLLVDTDGGVPRATGVHLDSGVDLPADLVVDASGRRSMIPKWLTQLGCPPVVRSEECGLVYFGRNFRVRDGVTTLPPLNRGFGAGAALPRFGVLLIPSEQGHVSVAIHASTTDSAMKAVRAPEVFHSVVGAVPTVAPWLDVLVPTTEVYPMGGLQSTLVRLVTPAGPVVHGLHVIGDACSTTNPTFARGLSFALAQAAVLCDLIATFPDDLSQQATAMDAWVTTELEPFYNDAIAGDAVRRRQIRDALQGGDPTPTAVAPGARPTLPVVMAASFTDPFVWHRLARYQSLLATPAELFDDPDVRARVEAAAGASLPRPAGPSNEELAELLLAR